MKKMVTVLAAVLAVSALRAAPPASAPLKLVAKYKMPSAVKGHFDHFGVDLQEHRLFATPEGYKSVLVFDIGSGKLLHTVSGIGIPHAVLYREDLNRFYVTDGGEGALKIYDGKTYRLLKSVKLFVDSDSIVYDPASKDLYVVNGGGDANQTASTISVIDTTSGEKIGDIKIDGDTLEAMAIETSSPKLYVNNRAKNQVDVIDREKRTLLASWPVTLGKVNVAMAFDEANHRLFLGCRSGQVVVIDTETGKELQALPIEKGVDDLVFDPASKRIYAACGGGAGSIDVYQEESSDHYQSLGKVATGPGAKTARLVPEVERYFVALPAQGGTRAEILVYQIQ